MHFSVHSSPHKPTCPKQKHNQFVCHTSGLSKLCFWQTVILLGWHPPFSSFSLISGVRGAKSLVLVGRMQYQYFRLFSSKPPVFGRGQNDRFPKRRFRQPWIPSWPIRGRTQITLYLESKNRLGGLGFSRRPPDHSSNLCLPKTFATWLFGGCFGPPSCCFSYIKRPKKHPPTEVIYLANVLGGHRLDD